MPRQEDGFENRRERRAWFVVYAAIIILVGMGAIHQLAKLLN